MAAKKHPGPDCACRHCRQWYALALRLWNKSLLTLPRDMREQILPFVIRIREERRVERPTSMGGSMGARYREGDDAGGGGENAMRSLDDVYSGEA